MKSKLVVWNNETFGTIKVNKQKIWEAIQAIDKKVEESGVLIKDDLRRKNSLMGEMYVLLRGEELHWKQKAKCK